MHSFFSVRGYETGKEELMKYINQKGFNWAGLSEAAQLLSKVTRERPLTTFISNRNIFSDSFLNN